MAKEKGLTKKQIKSIIATIALIISLIISAYYAYEEYKAELAKQQEIQVSAEADANKFTSGNDETVDLSNDKLNILFFYVGQADCTFLKFKDTTMLIDAGNNEDGKNIVNYLKENGITKINYLIGTHADEDHIGGLDDVVKGLDIEKIYMPKVGSDAVNYKNVVKQATNKNLKVETPKVGDTFDFADAKCEVLAQMDVKDVSKNNSSIVFQMNYGNTKYLFTGDAEKEVENSRTWEKVDVLKVGHHGSATSSSQKFLDQVKPHYAVIEVGKNNSYRLPNNHTIERLQNSGATVLRTDINQSSFWMTSDGNTIEENEVKVNLDGNKI